MSVTKAKHSIGALRQELAAIEAWDLIDCEFSGIDPNVALSRRLRRVRKRAVLRELAAYERAVTVRYQGQWVPDQSSATVGGGKPGGRVSAQTSDFRAV